MCSLNSHIWLWSSSSNGDPLYDVAAHMRCQCGRYTRAEFDSLEDRIASLEAEVARLRAALDTAADALLLIGSPSSYAGTNLEVFIAGCHSRCAAAGAYDEIVNVTEREPIVYELADSAALAAAAPSAVPEERAG